MDSHAKTHATADARRVDERSCSLVITRGLEYPTKLSLEQVWVAVQRRIRQTHVVWSDYHMIIACHEEEKFRKSLLSLLPEILQGPGYLLLIRIPVTYVGENGLADSC